MVVASQLEAEILLGVWALFLVFWVFWGFCHCSFSVVVWESEAQSVLVFVVEIEILSANSAQMLIEFLKGSCVWAGMLVDWESDL